MKPKRLSHMPLAWQMSSAAQDAAANGLSTLKPLARRWIESIDERRRQAAAWSFTAATIAGYVEAQGEQLGQPLQVSPLSLALTYQLEQDAQRIATAIGIAAASLPFLEASYQLCSAYTSLLPPSLRSALGAYYTPTPLAARLLDLASESGVNWATARVLDPASGGGAFLVPVALRIRDQLVGVEPAQFLEHLTNHLAGFEIDPFAAWLTQVWLEIAFSAEARAAGRPVPTVVRVCDALDQMPADDGYDLVIGNPPYGRVSLSAAQRNTYRRGLFGHANLYGVFTDLAIRWTKPGGVIAYVTPTSFLSGEYFKALRALLAREASPLAIDFLHARRGVFEDVLQETMLATYRCQGRAGPISVHYLGLHDGRAHVEEAGRFKLPSDPAEPWLAPREPVQRVLAERLAGMRTRLADWGYEVATGPLVWNRYKDQLSKRKERDAFPLIWAESVTADGRFMFRATKRNHVPYFRIRLGDEWLKIKQPCVLLQRTTAKEQARRLIAAELPGDFIAAHGAVVVENHLNMIRPISTKPKISTAALAAVLNSRIVDQAFRCISGSVAVSAFEIEALPLPTIAAMRRIESLINKRSSPEAIEAALRKIYFGRNA